MFPWAAASATIMKRKRAERPRAVEPSGKLPRLAGVDLNLLVALDALLHEANVTTAGRRIGLSQPSTSHALARLRDLMADPLLVREGRTLRRTALGERLAPEVQRLLADVEATLLGSRAFAPHEAKRTFRLATNDYCGAVVLPGLIERVRREAPGASLEVHVHQGPAPVRELARGALDLSLGTFLEVDPSLNTRALFDEGFVCLLREGHPRVPGQLTLARYVELEHLLVSAPGYGLGIVDQELERRGLRRRVAVRVPFFLIAPAIVASSDLIVTLPARLAAFAPPLPRLATHPVPLALARFPVQQVWHAGADRDPASIWLRAQVEEAARALTPTRGPPAAHARRE
jgi:DNA-binding transcriptional LysR family regulator